MPGNDFLEFLNLFLALQGAIATVVFGRYLLDRWPHWYEEPSTKMAIGFFIFFIGFTFLRFWTFLTRFAYEQGWYIPPKPGTIAYEVRPLFMIGAVIMTVGIICALREISVWKSNVGWTFVMTLNAILAAILAWGI